MKIRFSKEERQYWANVFIASSQITFGLAWASLFLPIDSTSVFVIVLNLSLSGIFWIGGWYLIRQSLPTVRRSKKK